MARCELCGKGTVFGRNVSHSKRHTNRRIMANVHQATVVVGGRPTRLKVCTRCVRSQNKAAA